MQLHTSGRSYLKNNFYYALTTQHFAIKSKKPTPDDSGFTMDFATLEVYFSNQIPKRTKQCKCKRIIKTSVCNLSGVRYDLNVNCTTGFLCSNVCEYVLWTIVCKLWSFQIERNDNFKYKLNINECNSDLDRNFFYFWIAVELLNYSAKL